MKKKRFIFLGGILVAIAIISTGIILAAPSLNLSGTTTNDTANLSWTNSDTEKSYNYDVKKKWIKDGAQIWIINIVHLM